MPKPDPGSPAYNWTGFYIFGGGGGGLWNADSNIQTTGIGPAGIPLTRDHRLGGSGWFGTAGIGYDWQFRRVGGRCLRRWSVGRIQGSLSDPLPTTAGEA